MTTGMDPPVRILTVNTGSSSVRLALLERPAGTETRAQPNDASAPPARALADFLDGRRVDAVAHRVVHGGPRLRRPVRLDAAVRDEIRRLAPLAPLHNPRALAWIEACEQLLGAAIPQVAVFDTAFFAELPAVASTYALPGDLCAQHGIRRYGFHGLAHEAMWRRWRELRPEVADGGRVISLQLGAGCSMAAIRDGRPLDTSMGFSPLEGLVMATRCGDLDPGALTYLLRSLRLSVEQLEALLNDQSGLRGVSGVSGDMRVLLASAEPGAGLAVDLYCYRARKYLGAYLAVLGGADAILFGGGVGEHAPAVRARILAGLEWAGIRLDSVRNPAAVGREARIGAGDIDIWVLPVDEAQRLADSALAVLNTTGGES